MKMINICDVEDENMVNVFEVPIDLVKMETVRKNFTVYDIQNEICNQIGGCSYVIVNKKGNPIRDMPNTRGQ